MQDEISKMSQENILVLLAFDEKSCSLLSSIDIRLFGSDIYRNIASECINYFKVWKQPADNHLPELLEKYLNNNEKSEIYKNVLINLIENKDKVNKEYVLKSLEGFLKQQTLKLGICNAADYLQSGDVVKAEQELLNVTKPKLLSMFDTGLIFNDPSHLRRLLGWQEEKEYIYTGIKELDANLICPKRKSQYLLMGLPKVGKSRFLIHMGKMAALQRKKVLHIALEMSEEETGELYIQAFFAIGKRKVGVMKHLLFHTNEDGKFFNTEEMTLDNIVTFEDQDKTEKIIKLVKEIRQVELVIKEFPEGYLTIDMLKLYLDSLEASTGFIPDVLIVDYPDLMSVNRDAVRTSVSRNFVDLRGLSQDRNLFNLVVTQSNRVGEGVKLLTASNLSEDFSKVMTADEFLTLNQTEAEYELGLARLYHERGRGSRKGSLTILSQNYSIGQFCISSARMSRSYESFVKSSNSDMSEKKEEE
mgnify:CR=1 FL=1